MNIAVIGSGISGFSAAYYLAQRHAVTLYEQDHRPGGHTNTIAVPTPQGELAIDTGWIVFNAINYPNLSALFAELGIRTRPVSMSFGVSIGEGAYEWTGSDRVWTVFAQPANLLRPAHWRLLLDILRLNAHCRRLLRQGSLPDGSLGEFLDAAGFSPQLSSCYLLPMAGLIWSCSPRRARDYPAAEFLRFFESHSLFAAAQAQPLWHTVVGGSHQYLQQLRARFAGELRLQQPVRRIRRGDDGVWLATDAGETRYDRVVCATHSDQALALLADAAADERAVLGGIPYSASRVVLHTDESLLPRRRAAWASWNYRHTAAEVHDQPVCGSYWMNPLQELPGPTNYIVTLNPPRALAPERVLYDTVYHHPYYATPSLQTHARLPAVQGRGGLWFAGAWTGYGFHEDGLRSGLRAVAGIDRACLPAWAALGEPALPRSDAPPLTASPEAA